MSKTEPPTLTDAGTELEMIAGHATERTADAVEFVDARCVGCLNVTVCNVPHSAKNWTRGSTFANRCIYCHKVTPHNITAKLLEANRNHPRGYLYTEVESGGKHGQ